MMLRSFSQWILIKLALFIAILGFALTASAETLPLEDQSSYDLNGYMEVLPDPANILTVQQAVSRNDWTGTVRGKVPDLGFTQAAIWVRFSLANQADTSRKFYVSFEYPVASSVVFYTKSPHGGFHEEHTGSKIPATANVVPDRHFLFPLTIGSGETAVFYLRVHSTARMTLPVRILSDQALFRKAIRDYTIYGALSGLLALVMLYFIGVGSFMYKGTPVWFALYSTFFGLHTAIRGGFIRLLLPDSLVGIIGILQLVVIAGLFFTGAKFFRLFLSLKSHSKTLDRIMMFFQYLSLTFILVFLFPDPLIMLSTFILIVINPLFSIGLAFYFWRKKNVSNAGLFAIGWIVPHSVAVYDFFRLNGLIPYQPLGEWPIPFSLFIALLFLSIALIRQNAVDHLMAQTDPLTGLANRRKLDEMLYQEWDRCRRLHSPLSVIMADVDLFKKYNDAFGHKAGDMCLCRIANVLKSHTQRTGDLAARYGGEEFVLLLPNLDAASAYVLAEKIRNIVSQAANTEAIRRHGHKITISLGTATVIPEEGRNPDDLIVEADKAMYEAKRAGRNQTVSSTVGNPVS
ncbi:MAG: diguanylate cyclase [Smithella sp.]|jgi:diguanylate cyclase (GGDEF)-like protein